MSENKEFKQALQKLMKTLDKSPEEDKRPVFIKSLEWDIGEDWMRKKLENREYAEKVYNALCNTQWENVETKEVFHCSWRYAGGIVANNRRFGEDYMDFYATGGEGSLDTEVVRDFAMLGWINTYESPTLSHQTEADLQESADILNEINKKESHP